MVVLLEYIDLLQLHKQSTAIVWVALSPFSPTHGYAAVLSNVGIIKFYVKSIFEQL